MAHPTVDQLASALARVDTASTKVGTGVTAVASHIDVLKQRLADAIANNVPVAELQPLVDQFGAEADQLEALAAVLEPLGHDATNPAPVPVPEPLPELPSVG